MRGRLLWSVISNCNTKEEEAEFCRALYAVVWWVDGGWLAESTQLLAPFLNRYRENDLVVESSLLNSVLFWRVEVYEHYKALFHLNFCYINYVTSTILFSF